MSIFFKRFGIALCAAWLGCPAFALRPGDAAAPLAPPVDYLAGEPFALNGKAVADESGAAPLRLAVFLYCRAPGSANLLRQLDALRRQYAGKLRIVVVTPDPAGDAKQLLTNVPVEVSFAVDRARTNTPKYMAGSLLYPFAFAVAPDGEIIWCGEAVDAPEMVERYVAGSKFGEEQRKIAALIDEMQNYLRGGEDRQLKKCTAEILKLEPGHPGALRIRGFVLENSGRLAEAWKLLETEIDRSPKLARLYVSAFDLISRNPELESHLAGLLDKFARNISEPRYLIAMAWALLNRFDANILALQRARDLLLASRGKSPTPEWASTYALLSYRLGDLKAAANYAEIAAAGYEKIDSAAAAECRERAKFYRAARELAGQTN